MRLAKTFGWRGRSATFILPKFHGFGKVTWWNQREPYSEFFQSLKLRKVILPICAYLGTFIWYWVGLFSLSLCFQLRQVKSGFWSNFTLDSLKLEKIDRKLSLRQRNESPSEDCYFQISFYEMPWAPLVVLFFKLTGLGRVHIFVIL